MKELSFWAQSLDNQSPDLIFKNNEELSDDTQRQQLISEIYAIPRKKIESWKSNSGVTIRFSDPKFVIEVVPIEKDQVGRPAPVVIYGELPEEEELSLDGINSLDWINRSCNKISDVVGNKLNRTLSQDVIETIKELLTEALEEKKEGRDAKTKHQSGLSFPRASIIGLVSSKQRDSTNDSTSGWFNRSKQRLGNVISDFRNRQITQNKIEKTEDREVCSKREPRNMNLDAIPSRKRRAILVLASDELTRLEYTDQGNKLLLNEQIHLLVPTDELDSSLGNKLEGSGLLETGNLLIQNPYDSSDYVSLDQASSAFALAKYFHFTTLCGLLGAQEVVVEQVEVKTSKGKQIFKGSLTSLYATGNVEGESKTFEAMRNNLRIKSMFNGGQPNLEEAEAHLRQCNLLNDISMTSLIDQRKGSNPIKSRELTLSLSEESKRTLKVISDVKIPTYADLQTQLDQFKKEAYEFTLTIKVEF